MGLTRRIFPSIVSDQTIYVIEKVIRKLAHYSIYFALGVSVLFSYIYGIRAFCDYEPEPKKQIAIPLLLCFAYSVTDELHQLFVPDRSGVFTDCLLDTVGAFSGIMCVMLALYILRKKSEK